LYWSVVEQADVFEGLVHSEGQTGLYEQVDLVLQFVGQAEISHRRRDHDLVMAGEVCDDGFDSLSCLLLSRSSLFAHERRKLRGGQFATEAG